MATQTLEAKLSHSAAVTQWERNVENTDVDQAFAEMLSMASPPVRRYEERMDCRRMCAYEVLEAIEGEAVVIGQGEAFALNQSTEGMLLLIALAPHAKQLIEVHTRRSRWGRREFL